LDETLNASDVPHERRNDSEWQRLGELELPAGMDLDDAIRSWLAELFVPLALPEDFLIRFLHSAQDAAARVFRNEAGRQSDHIHLVIHAPHDREAKQGTWGFFHVEKMLNPVEESSPVAHSIEFYLYVEGRA
jgi:hypothetical protein